MYFLALGAAALAIGVAAWANRRIPALPAIAALLGLEAVTLVFAEVLDTLSTPILVALWVATLVISLATTGTVFALAFAERKPLAIAGAACWAAWWILDAIFVLWAIQTSLGGTPAPPPDFNIAPCIAGTAAALLVALAALGKGKQPGATALVAVLAGFLLVWCLGEAWMMRVSESDDAERIGAVRLFSKVGYVGWHAVLAVLLWRTQLSSRRASP